MFSVLLPNLIISVTQKVTAEETSDKVNASSIYINVNGGLHFSEEVMRNRVKWLSVSGPPTSEHPPRGPEREQRRKWSQVTNHSSAAL